jgi:hypothetical protein
VKNGQNINGKKKEKKGKKRPKHKSETNSPLAPLSS